MGVMQRWWSARLFTLLLSLAGCERVPTTNSTSTSLTEPRQLDRPAPASPAQRTLNATSLQVLKDAIESKDYAVRLVALEALGQARVDALVPWLEHALGDPEHDVRLAATQALINIRTPRAVAVLTTVRDDKEEGLDIRALAASALLEVP